MNSWDEENIKSKFEGYEETPSDRVWEGIANELDNSRGYKWLWYFIPALVLLLGSIGGITYYNTGDFQKATNEENLHIAGKETADGQTGNTGDQKDQNNTNNKGNAKTGIDNLKSGKNGESGSSNNNNLQGKDKAFNASPGERKAGNSDNPVTNQQGESNENRAFDQPGHGDNREKKDEAQLTAANDNSNEQEGVSNKSAKDGGKLRTTGELNKYPLLLAEPSLLEDDIVVTAPLLDRDSVNQKLNDILNDDKNPAYSDKGDWRFGISGGAFSLNHVYSLDKNKIDQQSSNGQSITPKSGRTEEAEKEAWGARATLNGYYPFSDRLEVSFGLGYERIIQDFHFEHDSYERQKRNDGAGVDTQDGPSFPTNSFGERIEGYFLMNYAEKAVVETNISSLKATNYYSFVTLPIGIRYQFLESKVDLFVSAGTEFRYLTGLNTYFLDPGRKVIYSVEYPAESPFRRVQINGSLRLAAEYSLGKHFSIQAVPNTQIGTGSIYKDEFAIDKQSYRFGLDLGLIYNF